MTDTFLDQIRLRDGGGGGDPRDGLCVMELVSWLEGAEIVTDRPGGACPILTSFAIALNDSAPSARTRNRLTPLAPLLVGSHDDHASAARASYIRQALARDIAPLLLRQLGQPQAAAALRAAEDDDEITAVARRLCADIDWAPNAHLLTRVLEGLGAGDGAGLPEFILSRLDDLSASGDDARLRRLVWRKLASILESALHLGKRGEPDDPAVRARLDALRVHLAAQKEEAARKPLPSWVQAVLSGSSPIVSLKPDPVAA